MDKTVWSLLNFYAYVKYHVKVSFLCTPRKPTTILDIWADKIYVNSVPEVLYKEEWGSVWKVWQRWWIYLQSGHFVLDHFTINYFEPMEHQRGGIFYDIHSCYSSGWYLHHIDRMVSLSTCFWKLQSMIYKQVHLYGLRDRWS